jgi:uncharacterized protein
MELETLDALDAFLMSDRAPEEGMQLSDLDGFLTGVALTPRSMSPPDLLSVVWGNAEPAYADEDEARFVMNTILDRLDEIEEGLQNDPNGLNPIMWEGPDGDIVVDDWAAGFLEAVSLHAADWRPVFEDDDAFLAIAPIIVAGQDLESLQDMGVGSETKEQTSQELPKFLTACLVRMRDFLAQSGEGHENENPSPSKH